MGLRDRVTLDYYDRFECMRAVDGKGPKVQIADLSAIGKGRGLVAGKAYKTNELVYSDRSVFHIQHKENTAETLACVTCSRALGDLKTQLCHSLRPAIDENWRKPDVPCGIEEDESGEFNLCSFCNGLAECSAVCGDYSKMQWAQPALRHFDRLCGAPSPKKPTPPSGKARQAEGAQGRSAGGYSTSSSKSSSSQPEPKSSPTNNIIQCRGGCSLLFCGAACEEAAHEWHKYLCCGPRSAVPAEIRTTIRSLQSMTCRTNESLWILMVVFAQVYAKWSKYEYQPEQLDDCLAPLRAFTGAQWWEIVIKDSPTDDREMHVSACTEVLTDALVLMRFIFESQLAIANHDALLNVDNCSYLMGMVELNSISIEIPSKLPDKLAALVSAEPLAQISQWARRARAVRRAAKMASESNAADDDDEEEEAEEEEEDEEDGTEDILRRLFVGYEGVGLFPLVCMMNHDCSPNVEVHYAGDNTASVVAVRDIAAGEELCNSYINTALGLEERREELRDYDFTCRCARCTREAVGGAP